MHLQYGVVDGAFQASHRHSSPSHSVVIGGDGIFEVFEKVGGRMLLVHFVQQKLGTFPLSNLVKAVFWVGVYTA
jgi:hypothetical protein